jgi:hypothetical protein
MESDKKGKKTTGLFGFGGGAKKNENPQGSEYLQKLVIVLWIKNKF